MDKKLAIVEEERGDNDLISEGDSSLDDEAFRSFDAFSDRDSNDEREKVNKNDLPFEFVNFDEMKEIKIDFCGDEISDAMSINDSPEDKFTMRSPNNKQPRFSYKSKGVTFEIDMNNPQQSIAFPVDPVTIKTLKSSKFSATNKKIDAQHQDKPLKGTLIYIFYTSLSALGQVVAKMLYNRNPDLNPFNMLLMRSSFALGIMIIAYNIRLKKAVWDGVNRTNVGPLIFRTIQGSTANIISLSLNKYLNLTIISIVTNMSPLISMVLAYLILKEKIKGFEVFMLFMTIVGILVVIVGG